jgi:hypothetical protein
MSRRAVRSGEVDMDSDTDFFSPGTPCYFRRCCGHDVNRGSIPIAMSPIVSRLSVVTAYVALAFVCAIVLGVF